MKKIKAIDLFSGCGGVSIGLTQSGFDVTCAVEIDDAAVKAYKGYHLLKNVNVIKGDICDIKGNEILKAAGLRTDDLYLLAGCPPCQKFSMQNRRNNSDEKDIDEVKKLLMQFKRIIKEVYPPFVLMENVPGIKSSFDGRILKEFILDLENEGAVNSERYYVVSSVVNAADYGVPQLRKRFVLHAVRCDILERMKGLNLMLTLPLPTHSKKGENGKQKWVTVRETFEGLPKIKAGERYNDDKIKNHYCANLSDKNILRMRIIRENGGTRTALPQKLVLKCHTTYSGHTDVYGIMNPDAPAPTMTGGCLSYSKGRFGHPFEDRAISVREAARIQTFPDDYVFGESLTKAALEIGNAVPIKLVQASGNVFMELILQLMGK
ncbi:MAG: DNA cytosine methyltransferase [Clostridia bacterium]|nr:DNA cytosine methyltransferase [Clostridia bacterium]